MASKARMLVGRSEADGVPHTGLVIRGPQVVATRIYRVSMGDVRFLWGSILLRRGALWAPSGPKSNPKEATRPPEGDQLCHNTFIWAVVCPWTPGPRCLLDTQGAAQNVALGFVRPNTNLSAFREL